MAENAAELFEPRQPNENLRQASPGGVTDPSSGRSPRALAHRFCRKREWSRSKVVCRPDAQSAGQSPALGMFQAVADRSRAVRGRSRQNCVHLARDQDQDKDRVEAELKWARSQLPFSQGARDPRSSEHSSNSCGVPGESGYHERLSRFSTLLRLSLDNNARSRARI
jgi:hypothetical protein